MQKKVKFAALGLSVIILAAGSAIFPTVTPASRVTVLAENTDEGLGKEILEDVLNGLVKEDGAYHYYENGQMVTNQWVTTDDATYYLKKNGNAAVLKYKINGKYYVFNEEGQLMQPSSKKVISIDTDDGTKKYYVNPDGTTRSGWAESRQYYFYKDGEMATGIMLVNGKFYCFKSNGKYNANKTSKIQKAAKYEKPFANLKKLIGNPNKTKYYASCYGSGKDGVLSYDGFTVYTYKPTKGKEIFMNVE